MTLRIVLLVIGALFVAGIVFASMHQKKQQNGLVLPRKKRREDPMSEDALDQVWQNEILGKSRVISTRAREVDATDDFFAHGGTHRRTNDSASEGYGKQHNTKVGGQELIVFYIMAKDNQKFSGHRLLQSLSGCGLSHGPLGIFHYFDRADNNKENKAVWFSIASAVEPGKFDMQRMGSLACPGLCLFMSMKNQDSLKAYNKLLMTAQQLVDNLHGELLDNRRQPCSQDYLEECRARILNHSMSSQEEMAMA